jgi:hypothetical protein
MDHMAIFGILCPFSGVASSRRNNSARFALKVGPQVESRANDSYAILILFFFSSSHIVARNRLKNVAKDWETLFTEGIVNIKASEKCYNICWQGALLG